MRRQLVLIVMLLVILLPVINCGSKEKRIEGEVVKIYGTLPALVTSSGALFGNESVRISDTSLVYMIKVGEDIFTINVLEGSKIARESLIPRICIGTKITFTVKIVAPTKSGEFNPNHHAGSNSADDIGVAKPCIQ
jgi:hypothetical protein